MRDDSKPHLVRNRRGLVVVCDSARAGHCIPSATKPGADSLGDAATIAEMQELFRKSGEPDGNRTFREVVLMTSLDSRR